MATTTLTESATAEIKIVPATDEKYTTGRIELFNGTKDGERAYLDPSTGLTNLNPKQVYHVKIHDIRQQEPRPSLIDNGYQFIPNSPTFLTEDQFMRYTSPDGKQFIQDAYWPEVRRLVEANFPGAKNVTPWHFSVRRAMPGLHPDEVFFMRTGVSQPQATIHVDNDHSTADDHLRRVFGDEKAQELKAKYPRWAMVNTWRPVGNPVKSWPLLMVDHSPVTDWKYEDRVAQIHRSNDPVYYKKYDNFLKHHPDYIYRYVKDITPEEVIMFRDYDSRKGKYYGCPHGAFQDDNTPADAPPRRSIEVRCFVFFEDEE